jgi:hypothetical protein
VPMDGQYLRAICLCALLSLRSTEGAVYFDGVTWDGGDVLSWFRASGLGAPLTAPTTDGNPGGYLRMDFPANNLLQTDGMVTTNEGYVGDYTAYDDLSVSFDFQGYAASAQALYFHSTYGTGSEWYWYFTLPSHDWYHTNINFRFSDNWVSPGEGDSNEFQNALMYVDLIGVTASGQDANNPFYFGVDNWQFDQVPEPGVAVVLATAFISLAGVFRRQIRTAGGSAWAHLHRPRPGRRRSGPA